MASPIGKRDLAGLSVVIPTRNGARRLETTLASIAAQDVGAGLQVVIVDDGSEDDSAKVAREFPLPSGRPTVVRHETGRGRAAACNQGIRIADGDVVVILDDDMTLGTGALATHLSFVRDHPRSAALGRIDLDSAEPRSCFLRFLLREGARREALLRENAHDVPFSLCLTGNFAAERAVLLEVGGFDERIARYGFEDIELGFRLREAGVTITYLPEAASLHRAFMTDLDRYLDRHRESGVVARELAERYPSGPFREYLRVDGPPEIGVRSVPAGLAVLRLSNRLLLLRPVRRVLGSRVGFAAFRALLAAGAALRLDRIVHLGYHVARDLRYFEGYFGERCHGGSG